MGVDRLRPVHQLGHLRVARAPDDLGAVARFYHGGLGLDVLYELEGHEGFDRVMPGREGPAIAWSSLARRATGSAIGTCAAPPWALALRSFIRPGGPIPSCGSGGSRPG